MGSLMTFVVTYDIDRLIPTKAGNAYGVSSMTILGLFLLRDGEIERSHVQERHLPGNKNCTAKHMDGSSRYCGPARVIARRTPGESEVANVLAHQWKPDVFRELRQDKATGPEAHSLL